MLYQETKIYRPPVRQPPTLIDKSPLSRAPVFPYLLFPLPALAAPDLFIAPPPETYFKILACIPVPPYALFWA